MGYVRADILLSNPRDGKIASLKVNALVDTGSLMLCVPEHIKTQLGLQELEKREISTADGKRDVVSYCGPVQIRFESRNCFTGALVLGDEVLLGAVPLEDLDLVVLTGKRILTVNPDYPNMPHALVK